jgi:adenylate cyclase
VLWLLGYPDHALRKSQDALALARELSHPTTMANALSWAASLHQHRGDLQGVQERVEEVMTLATDHGITRYLGQGSVLRGWLLVEQGQKETGIAQMIKTLDTGRARGTSGGWDAYYAVLLADAHLKAGMLRQGLKVVTDALALAHQTDCRHYEAELLRIKGELLLAQSDHESERAESCLVQAIEVARGQSAKSLELRAAMSLSRLWYDQGKKAEARQLLGEIYGWFTEGFDTADLKAAKALLEELT